MLSKFVFAAAALQATFASASFVTRDGGKAIVSNRCPYDLWIQSVDSAFSSEIIHLPARSKHTEPFRTPPAGGVSFKVSKSNSIVAGKHTQLEYTITNGQMWYDISFVDCAKGKSAANCPGHKLGIAIGSPEKKCAPAVCKSGDYCVKDAYYVDQPLIKLGVPEPVFTCGDAGTGMKVYFKLCADEPALDKRSVAGRATIGGEGWA